MGEDHTGQTGPTNQRVTVPEAAELLGITAEAVRMRIKRGTLRSERQAGRVFVLLGQGQPTEQPTDRPDEPNALISQLRDEIAYLRDENRRKDELLAAALSRIPPALEAPSEARESSQTVEAEPQRTEPRPATVESREGAERPWWRRVFGG